MQNRKTWDVIALTVSNNIIVRSIRRGLLYMMPMVLIGSIVLAVLNLPVQAFQNAMYFLFGEAWREVGLAVHTGTFQIMALMALVSISYAFAYEHEPVKSGELNAIAVVLTAFSSYISFTWIPDEAAVRPDTANSVGMFTAIVVSIISTWLFLFFYRHRMFRMNMYAYDSDAILVSSLRTLVPALMTILIFTFARLVFLHSGITAAIDTLYNEMSHRFSAGGGNLFSAIGFSLATNFLWFFGLHGTNILDGIAIDFFRAASDSNILLAQSGLAPTNILTKEFFDTFVYMGGSGCTLGLIIALLLTGRSSRVNRVAGYSLFPGLFNINEIMVYGLPIIFNPYYFVPFLMTPVVLCITTWIAMTTGLVPLTSAQVEWTTPIFISGYVSTGSVSAILLQAVNLTISILIYYPFVRLYERHLNRSNLSVFDKIKDEVFSDPSQRKPLITRYDEVGIATRALAMELDNSISGNGQGPYLEYQPKVNLKGTVYGAEALLRWNHSVYGPIPPPVTLAIADEGGLGNRLGSWIIQTAFESLKRWRDQGYDLVLSVNLSPRQLQEDETLLDTLRNILRKTELDPGVMEIELTEEAAVDQSESTRRKLESIKNMGFNISIDDFGMGNSSILYLRDFYANVVKLDMTLVRNITVDRHSQEIVRSVVQLCQELNVDVIAEGVETAEQMESLRKIGCTHYQGYYFSRSRPEESFLQYVREMTSSPEQ